MLRFIARLRTLPHSTDPPYPEVSTEEINKARLRWIKDIQSCLTEDKSFPTWKHQFGLFQDEQKLWKYGGRRSNSSLPPSAQNPILLDSKHHLTSLLIWDAHKRVLHNGVRETLSELRSTYWVIRGRQIVRKVIHGCVICRKFEGAPYKGVSAPPLPEFRV